MDQTKRNIEPVVIEDDKSVIFSLMRDIKETEKIVIFVPAITGSRIGPQRIFVETSVKLLENNISSLCIELPGSGDSYYKNEENNTGVNIFDKYFNCLDSVLNHLKKFKKEFILVSISIGCLPIYSYAVQHNINKVILLSPALMEENQDAVNKENIRKYFIKLFNKETWLKLFMFKINTSKIIGNIINVKRFKKNNNPGNFEQNNNKTEVYAIYGGNDAGKKSSDEYFKELLEKEKLKGYHSLTVEGSDHSFFGWKFKNQVTEYIIDSIK